MKKYTLFYCLLLSGYSLFPQDTLVLKDGKESYVSIIEIDEENIKYRKQALPNGPVFSIAADKVFMIFYKGGFREIIKPAVTYAIKNGIAGDHSAKPSNDINNRIIGIKNGWELILDEQKLAPDKNKKWLTYRAVINVSKNGKYITHISVFCSQHIKKKVPGEPIDKSFIYKSNISFAVPTGKPLDNLLYERYESYTGKGLGWGVDWNFLKQGPGACTIKQFFTNSEVGDIKLKTDQSEYKLQDCSSIEKRVLSAALLWLDANLLNNK